MIDTSRAVLEMCPILGEEILNALQTCLNMSGCVLQTCSNMSGGHFFEISKDLSLVDFCTLDSHCCIQLFKLITLCISN